MYALSDSEEYEGETWDIGLPIMTSSTRMEFFASCGSKDGVAVYEQLEPGSDFWIFTGIETEEEDFDDEFQWDEDEDEENEE